MAKLKYSSIGAKKKKPKPKKGKPKVDPLAAQVESNLSLKFKPVEDELAGERRISDQMLANTGNWWTQYQRDVAAANQRTQQGYQQAQGAVYGQANAARAQDASQASQLDQSAKANAALRGTTAGPSPAAQAQAARQTSMTNFGSLVGAQGAAQGAYGNAQYANAGGIRALELGKENQRRRLVEKKAQDLAREKGQARVAERASLSDAAWKTQLEEATFGLKRQDQLADNARQDAALSLGARDKKTKNRLAKQKARQDARDKAAARRVSQRKTDATIRGQNLTDQRARSGGGKGKGGTRYKKGYGNTNVSLAKAVANRQKWTNLLDHPRGTELPKGTDPTLFKALVEYRKFGGKVTKKQALKIYRTYGFRIPYKKAGKVRRSPNAPGSGGGARPT